MFQQPPLRLNRSSSGIAECTRRSIQDHPGDCPICHMALTPLNSGSSTTATGQKENPLLVGPHARPSSIADHPGKSAMGMDLVPVYANQGGPEVQIDPGSRAKHGCPHGQSHARARSPRRCEPSACSSFRNRACTTLPSRSVGGSTSSMRIRTACMSTEGRAAVRALQPGSPGRRAGTYFGCQISQIRWTRTPAQPFDWKRRT